MSENPCPCNLAAWPSATMNTNVLELPMYSAASNRKQEFTLRRSPRPGRRWNLQTSSSPSPTDRKSTRLNSSHLVISYAVFCLKENIFRHLGAQGRGTMQERILTAAHEGATPMAFSATSIAAFFY